MKKNIQLVTKLSLCCTILLSVQTTDAINWADFSHARGLAIIAAKRMAKLGGLLLGAYFAAGSLLNNCTIHPATTSHPAAAKVIVHTDGKVTIRPSQDGKIKVTHEYGASRRSDVPQITFGETFNQADGTLTIQGLLEKCRPSKFQRFVEWLFRLKPQRTLHHIIEAPGLTEVEILASNPEKYTHDRQQPISIGSIAGNITVRAAAGNVVVDDSTPQAKLTRAHHHAKSDERLSQGATAPQHARGESINKVNWDQDLHPAREIRIYTPDEVAVRNFTGRLLEIQARKFEAERHPQNMAGQVVFNGVRLPYLKKYPAPLKDYITGQYSSLTDPELAQRVTQSLNGSNTLAQQNERQRTSLIGFLIRHWSPTQLVQWSHDKKTFMLQHLLYNGLQNMTPEQAETWAREDFLQWLPARFLHDIPAEQLRHYLPYNLETGTRQWSSEQIEVMVPAEPELQSWREILLRNARSRQALQ